DFFKKSGIWPTYQNQCGELLLQRNQLFDFPVLLPKLALAPQFHHESGQSMLCTAVDVSV
ncbi:hypothetical protein, partial [Fischerella muscicola]|uniref:hypothetical protein n=1 Tax=Fischerella muscicola TaxID=92938 RepID=UPI001CA5D392